jgi:hypothetical protein
MVFWYLFIIQQTVLQKQALPDIKAYPPGWPAEYKRTPASPLAFVFSIHCFGVSVKLLSPAYFLNP